EIAKMLLNSGIEVDAHDIYGNTSLWTALHQARLTGGKYDVVELLLQHGADPYSKNRVGEILVGKKKEPLGESLSPFIVSTREGRQNELELFEKYKNIKDAK
ncbi:MAG: hypothetical protein H7259_03640, partial [Cytophagales bacterium]|nr:hypothetical protein [Cytophaga sp.]